MLVANVLEEGVYGGPQKRVVLIANYLQVNKTLLNQDIRTVVIGPSSADRFIAECDRRSIDYYAIDITPLTRQPKLLLKYVLNFFSDVKRTKRAFENIKPDIAHCSGGSWSVKSCIAAKLAKIPFIWHMNDTSQPWLILIIFKLLVRILKPSGILYSGNRTKEYYQRYINSEIPWEIARPPIDELIRNIEASDVVRPQNLPNYSYNLVLVGNINPTKGTDLAVRAVVQLINEGRDLSLSLIGAVKSTQSEFFQTVKKLALPHFGERICYIGSEKNVVPYFLHADIALCTSLSESGPMSAWEAAATRCSLVSSDVGDVGEVLGEDGAFLFSPNDLDDLILKLRYALDNSKIRSERASIAYKASHSLLVNESANNTMSLYRRACVNNDDVVF